MSLHIVLYQPEIPANTGNIARTCAGTNATLHLIRPLGFSTEDRMLKRAGCDYWPNVTIHYYDSIEELFATYPEGLFYYIETVGSKPYTDFDFRNTEVDHFFVFGKETTGLPNDLTEANTERCLRIPQTDLIRSLNLSNTAAIVLYEALRQQGFPNVQ
ncbi:tRNA (uridine(34)/cytosine(34)/5-carboxymethylaminomethyluridine(34)-2'-O)-methyltransferase TrmL [Shouchella clausii]|uniref:Putative tRNA (cytidine(34)-2'-O)-methyltransferase n=1 Tax=Shouchella clausii TaxID=79880 RepID=A0A268RWY9_SHOCL|nr:tRNA (uridine(34)/cytosine(34)/5-carboxymethylaminomethyluridine(34)-2'-O)-methyltransferase TrmL [Shouchella clausii]PAD12548.1 tRNA (uridine(34)/cytosine(34)/5-carboxymethylaminomethyluridine(34)-2'-O)-methyltransferase TrmL [Shouchella clausii]PAD41773.1 tRNA (uridine(34)/cytosine(34)/5-carboxymethylaminomethyluridine(34)-2'-O)-methyltransferase TrmL [Bacillus sp. 7520-S]PAE94207.1 tRNA (uridine(34)/cytosine(34)/5-carboxymethylaminomethyluridine(34)-2'-O)-methyltransferase TrmL [Shouchella